MTKNLFAATTAATSGRVDIPPGRIFSFFTNVRPSGSDVVTISYINAAGVPSPYVVENVPQTLSAANTLIQIPGPITLEFAKGITAALGVDFENGIAGINP